MIKITIQLFENSNERFLTDIIKILIASKIKRYTYVILAKRPHRSRNASSTGCRLDSC